LLLAGGPTLLAASDQSKAEALKILDRAIVASGGEETLDRFQCAHWKGEGKVEVGNIHASFLGEWWLRPPGKARVRTVDRANGRVRWLVLNDPDGWYRMNDQTRELPKKDLALEREQFYLYWLAMLTPLRKAPFELEGLEESRVRDRAASGIRVKHPDFREARLFFDKETGLLTKIACKRPHPQMDGEVEQEAYFDDYRPVQGGQRAHRLSITWDGKPFFELKITGVKLLTDLPQETFAKP
jgi:hypothetical protein